MIISSSFNLSIKTCEYSTNGGIHLSYSDFLSFLIKSTIGTLKAPDIWTEAPECELIFKIEFFKKQAKWLIDKFSIKKILLFVETLLKEFRCPFYSSHNLINRNPICPCKTSIFGENILRILLFDTKWNEKMWLEISKIGWMKCI